MCTNCKQIIQLPPFNHNIVSFLWTYRLFVKRHHNFCRSAAQWKHRLSLSFDWNHYVSPRTIPLRSCILYDGWGWGTKIRGNQFPRLANIYLFVIFIVVSSWWTSIVIRYPVPTCSGWPELHMGWQLKGPLVRFYEPLVIFQSNSPFKYQRWLIIFSIWSSFSLDRNLHLAINLSNSTATTLKMESMSIQTLMNINEWKLGNIYSGRTRHTWP